MNNLLKEYLQFINETPIEDISHYGDVTSATNFTPGEIKQLQKPEYEKRIKNAFKKTPFIFDIVFLYHNEFDASDKKTNSDTGKYIPNKNATKIVNYNNFHILGNKNTITFVLLGNLSPTNRIPITPWILAHKIGHSLTINNPYFKILYKQFIDNVEMLERIIIKINNFDVTLSNEYKDLFDFRSYKTNPNDLFDSMEFAIELIALYLIKGKIIPNTNNSEIIQLCNNMNDKLFEIFSKLKGHVLNDV